MKFFISWSGERSKMIAIALKCWLEKFFQTIQVFMSESDIEPGTRWAFRLNDELQVSNYGIICLTPENQNSQWILFESGALSNQVQNRLTPLLYKLKGGDLKGPLSQFQYLKVDEDGLRKLANSINRNLEKPLTDDKMSEYFRVWWDKLYQSLNEIPAETKEEIPDKREDRELIEEILQYTRNQTIREGNNIRLREMAESELKEMNLVELTDYIERVIYRIQEGLHPLEQYQMQQKLLLAATIFKEKFPEAKEFADKMLSHISK